MQSQNIKLRAHDLSSKDRACAFKHAGGVVWLTGLSGAGKSTLAMALERRLYVLGYATYVLDGDNLRTGLNSDLGFSQADRSENIRRVGEVAALLADAGLLCISAFISPYAVDRSRARTAAEPHVFCEVYVEADLDVCESRDPKGLYRKAHMGLINDFTGVDAPYDVPTNPELVLNTKQQSVESAVEQLLTFVTKTFPLGRP